MTDDAGHSADRLRSRLPALVGWIAGSLFALTTGATAARQREWIVSAAASVASVVVFSELIVIAAVAATAWLLRSPARPALRWGRRWNPRFWRDVFHAAPAPLWTAAFAVLFAHQWMWAVLPATGWVLTLLSLLGRDAPPPTSSTSPEPIENELVLSDGLPRRPLRVRASAVGAAVLLQSAVSAIAAGSVVPAVLLTPWFIHWVRRQAGWRSGDDPPPSHGAERWLSRCAAVLALLLAVISLTRFSGHRGGGGFGIPIAAAEATPRTKVVAPAGMITGSEIHEGVILYSDQERQEIAVPRADWLRQQTQMQQMEETLEIPFWGVYWYFKAPDMQPPPESIIEHGQPDALSFRSTDGTPLTMEARQNLGRSIDLSCCRALDVKIRNADRYPGSVSVEVLVSDSSTRLKARSLGVQPVRSRPHLDWSWPRKATLETETLSFPLAMAFGLGRADEITVRFHLSPVRDERSARIAIQSFRFVPNRG